VHFQLAQAYAVSAASVAAVIDVWSRRIPNWITFGTFVVGLILNVWLSGLDGALMSITGAALGMALLLPFYLVRAIGAGDLKLLGALGAVTGPQVLVSVAIYGAIAGGLLSVVILLIRGRLLVALNDLFVLHRPPATSGVTAPYGVAIASGVYLSLILPSVLG